MSSIITYPPPPPKKKKNHRNELILNITGGWRKFSKFILVLLMAQKYSTKENIFSAFYDLHVIKIDVIVMEYMN